MSDSTIHSDDLPLDDVHRVLSHPTRRSVVRVLEGTNRTTTEAIAAGLSAADGGRRDAVGADGGRRDAVEADGGPVRIEVALHHVHLPMLADLGVLEYEPERGEIEVADGFEEVAAVLDRVSRERESCT